MLIHWPFSTDDQEPVNISLAQLRTAVQNASSEKQAVDSNAAMSVTADSDAVSPAGIASDDASEWSLVIIDEKYADALSSSATPLSDYDDYGHAFPADHKSPDGINSFLSASSPSNTPALNSVSQAQLEFNDGEVPLKEDADTFIITSQKYPSERNGTFKNEMAAAVRAPAVTASRAGEAAKRKAEDMLAPHTLKRAFHNVKGAIAQDASAYVNGVAAGYDVPEMAGRVIEPIVNLRDAFPSREETSRFVDRFTDKFQGWFGKRKRRRSTAQDILDSGNMEHMEDAHQVFAREMAAKARRMLVADGICYKWQIICDRHTMKWQYPLQRALEAFYLYHKQYMRPEELMDAEPSWFIDKQKGCFTLMLFAKWEVYDDQKLGGFNEFLATGFELPEMFCKMSTAAICPDPCPMAEEEEVSNDRRHGHKEDGVVWLKDDNEHSSEEEHARATFLENDSDKEDKTCTHDDVCGEDGVGWLFDDTDEENDTTTDVAPM